MNKLVSVLPLQRSKHSGFVVSLSDRSLSSPTYVSQKRCMPKFVGQIFYIASALLHIDHEVLHPDIGALVGRAVVRSARTTPDSASMLLLLI